MAPWIGARAESRLSSSPPLYSPLPVAERYPSRCGRGHGPVPRKLNPEVWLVREGRGVGGRLSCRSRPRCLSLHVFCSLAQGLLTCSLHGYRVSTPTVHVCSRNKLHCSFERFGFRAWKWVSNFLALSQSI